MIQILLYVLIGWWNPDLYDSIMAWCWAAIELGWLLYYVMAIAFLALFALAWLGHRLWLVFQGKNA